jgi:tRNA/rRNA methyltransferase
MTSRSFFMRKAMWRPGNLRSATVLYNRCMLSAVMRARLAVVLVGARNPSNIGAAARAMQDFGFSDLRVVNEYAPPFEAAQIQSRTTPALDGSKAAVGAAEVLANARRFNRLADAIADCALIAGTTAIGGRELTQTVVTLSEAAPQIAGELAARKVALLFGSEKTGLTNDQLSHCQLLLTIPMFAPEGSRHLSMNLGQAVAVCLYELARDGFEGAREIPPTSAKEVTAAARERLAQLVLETMAATGYTRRFPANAREHVVRQLAQQLGASEDEASTWMGFLRQILRNTNKNAPR